MDTAQFMMFVFVLSIVFSALIWGFVTETISKNKGYKGGFAWGLFFGIIGVIVVACRPENRDSNQSSNNVPTMPQTKSETKAELEVKENLSSADEMLKLKQLLDAGVLTQ
ncbi:MAG: hypothetical protein K2H26_01250 [Ruminococcus sp.]|nr:hypothetical protein [Ruminococcus sp.]